LREGRRPTSHAPIASLESPRPSDAGTATPPAPSAPIAAGCRPVRSVILTPASSPQLSPRQTISAARLLSTCWRSFACTGTGRSRIGGATPAQATLCHCPHPAGRRLHSGSLAFTVLPLFVCSNPAAESNSWYFPTVHSLISKPNCIWAIYSIWLKIETRTTNLKLQIVQNFIL
jgi:hypothetical protein